MIRPFLLTRPWSSSSPGDPLGRGEVHRDHRAPAVLGHVGQLLVAGDAGVVHDDVDAAELLLDVVGDPLRRVLGGDVEGEVVAVELLHQRLTSSLAACGTSMPSTVAPSRCSTRAICSPMPREAPVTIATLPSSGRAWSATLAAFLVPVRPEPGDLAGDVGGLGGAEERQRRGERRLGARRDVDQVDGAAAADLLAQRAGDTLERALGDPLVERSRSASGLVPSTTTRAHVFRLRSSGVRNCWSGDQLLGVGDPGRVEDQALELLTLVRGRSCWRCRGRRGVD